MVPSLQTDVINAEDATSRRAVGEPGVDGEADAVDALETARRPPRYVPDDPGRRREVVQRQLDRGPEPVVVGALDHVEIARHVALVVGRRAATELDGELRVGRY